MRIEQVRAELRYILSVKQAIEQRMTAAIAPVYDVADHDKVAPLTRDNIKQRVKTLALELVNDHALDYPVIISVMNGAFSFGAALKDELIALGYRFQSETIQVSSYKGTMADKMSIHSLQKIRVGERHVVFADDVCESGATLAELRRIYLDEKGARSVKLMALINKPQPREALREEPDFVGFTLGREFIVGYDMDYDELLRNYPHIGVVNPTTLPSTDEKAILAREEALNDELAVLLAEERKVARATRHVGIDMSALMHAKQTLFNRSTLSAKTGEGLNYDASGQIATSSLSSATQPNFNP